MTEKRKGPRYVPAALASMGALVLLVAACQTPVPTDPADLQELTAGKQVSDVDPVDGEELHRILAEEGGGTLVIEEADGDTYVIDAVKLSEIREKGHAELVLQKLKEHGKLGEVKLTLIHEDGTESARFGTLLHADDADHNGLVELKPAAETDYRFAPDDGASTLQPRTEAEAAKIKQLKAAGMEAGTKTEGGSR